MRTPLKLALACATLFAALTTSGLAEANAWRAEDDYTQVTATAPDHAGRPGVWQFMTQDPTSGTITPMPDFIASTGVDGVHVWETQAQGGLTALWGQNSSASDAVLAGTATVPAHAVFAHPSYYGDVAVLAWQNPLGMSIDVNVTGTITDFDPNGGNGVGWKLLNGTTTVLDSGSVAAPDSASDSIQGALQTTVPAGGKLYLVVDGSPTFSADDRAFDFDTTGIQLTIIQQHVAAGETWDLTSEWQDPHPRSANGAWSYGYQPAASTDVADITGMTDWVPLCFDGAATPGHGWTATNGVAWYENPKGADPVVECNSGVSIPARQLITSPASNGDKPTLTWTAASAGSVDVGGLVDDLDGGGGDGVDVTVKKVHGATVTPISSASATAPDAAEGTLTINTVAVDAGDKIILTVDPKGGYDYDTTGIRYGITPHTTTTGSGSGGGGSGSGDGGSTPTPQPPDPNVITLPFGMSITLQQLLGIDPATTNPANDPPKPIALDWYPYPSSKKRPATGYIDPTKQTPRTTVPNVTLRFWTMNDVMKDWQALSKQGIPIAVDFKPTSNPSFHNQPLLPGEVIGTDPSLSKQADSQPQTTTIANPFHITVSYFQPAPPPKAKVNKVKNPCKTVLAALPKGRAPYTAEYEAIVAKYKGSDCLITETRTKSTLTVAMATPHLDSPTNLRIAI
ncbi:MAG TPA: hypothetical protein VE570_15755, partial [Thermoleophilaceae bacterium]|nr:hypothetical protein [Thermoleophilaceae bacterium]